MEEKIDPNLPSEGDEGKYKEFLEPVPAKRPDGVEQDRLLYSNSVTDVRIREMVTPKSIPSPSDNGPIRDEETTPTE